MKKHLIIIGITLVLLTVGLSGCVEEADAKDTDGDGYTDDIDAFPNDKSEWIDTDKDGVGDNADDYPYDDRYSKIEYIIGGNTPSSYTLESNEGSGASHYITQEWKYVYVDWEVVYPSSLTKEQQENIFVEISTPITPYEESEYAYISTGHRNMKFSVNANNWGEWHYAFRNKTFLLYETGEDITITVKATMYKVK